jgi:hypothetical protein
MTRKSKKFFTLTCGVCAIACFAVSGMSLKGFSPDVTAETAESITLTQELKTQYLVGEILQIPSATIVYEGNSYVADSLACVYLPDGSILQGDRLTLNQTGNYTVVYTTNVSGVRVTAEKTFSVYENAYRLPNSCSYSYEETVKTQDPRHFTGGLNVELSPGTEFVYNKAIDISSTSTITPIVTFSPYQYTNYMLDEAGRPAVQAKEFFVRLTDAYDSENYVELYMLDRSSALETHEPGRRSYPYLSVGASGQIKHALDNVSRYDPAFDNGKIVEVDGSEYCAVYQKFGVSHGLVPCGQAIDNSGIGGDEQGGWFSVYYDSATARVYITAPTRNGKDPAIMKQILLNDLDSTSIYGTNGFKGFTTGEVYLSIRADSYLSDKAQFELLEVCGDSGKDFEKTTVEDTRSPLLTFDNVEEDSDFLVQRNTLVTLPTATAYDVNLKGAVETRVYYAYGTQKQVLINSDGGVFTPTKTGAYVAEYTALDTYGNKTVKTLLFSALDKEVLTFEVENLTDGFQAGTTVSLPQCKVGSLNGETYVNVYAMFADEKIEIDENILEFFVNYVGEYTITYEYGDVLMKKNYSYKVTSTVSENVTFSNFNLPKYFIKNAYYTFDKVYAYTYVETQPKAVETSVFVSEDGASEFKKIDINGYLVTANENLRFKYVYGNSIAYSELFSVIDVGFGGKIAMEKYFVGDITANAEKKYVELISNATTGDTTIKFANPIALSFFRFEFSVPDDASAFDGVEIKLTDYYDEKVFVVMGYYKNQTMTQLRVGDFLSDITQDFVGTNFALWYETNSKRMAELYGLSTKFENPFKSDRVFVEFTLKNATGRNGIRLTQLCNQPMTNNSRDRYAATFSYQNLFGGLNEINKPVTVFAGEATDVLSPYYSKNLRVSVETPSGSYVTATDGTVLEGASASKQYDFVTKEYGKYLVTYSYIDQNGQEVTGMYYIAVVDMQSPTITLENGYGEKTRVMVKAGKKVEVAEYTVSDNVTPTSELKTVVFVLKADGEFVEVTDGKFVAKTKGDYVVYYYCFDTDDNYSIVKYYVRAE